MNVVFLFVVFVMSMSVMKVISFVFNVEFVMKDIKVGYVVLFGNFD